MYFHLRGKNILDVENTDYLAAVESKVDELVENYVWKKKPGQGAPDATRRHKLGIDCNYRDYKFPLSPGLIAILFSATQIGSASWTPLLK